MVTTTRQTFKVHLPGLLNVLAEHFYMHKQVAIRELLQNAHDSCMRRAVEGKEPEYYPAIHISIDAQRRVLCIADNGCGLTAEEIDAYLTTIGCSATAEIRAKLAVLAWDESSRLIGQFGLGFLSAFLIASEVVLTTRSYKEGSMAVRWVSRGDAYYEVTPAERECAGTTIELTIKPEAGFVLQSRLLLDCVQIYADCLPVPVYVGDDPQPVNCMTAVWHMKHPEWAIRDYIQRVFGVAHPLFVLPLHDQTLDLGHDTLTLPLQGFLFIPPSSVASVREYGDVIVYIRHMFVCAGETRLLPPWARFVRGVVDCAVLQPTASREQIHYDEHTQAIQQALEAQLIDGLRRLAQDDPQTWQEIVTGHADVITGWAVQDDAFFEQVADVVPFQTSRGMLSLPKYLKLTGGIVYYVTCELGSLQEQLLAEGHDVPVIDASWFGVGPFLEKYAAFVPGTLLVHLDDEPQTLLRPVPEGRFAHLLRVYHERGIRAQVVAFRPLGTPALMLNAKDAPFLQEAHQVLDQDELLVPLAGLGETPLDTALLADNADEESADATYSILYLNASCSLVRQLAERPVGPAELAALMLIYQIARLFAGRLLTVADATEAHCQIIRAIEELLP